MKIKFKRPAAMVGNKIKKNAITSVRFVEWPIKKSIKYICVISKQLFIFHSRGSRINDEIQISRSFKNACEAKFETKKNRIKKLSHKLMGVPNFYE